MGKGVEKSQNKSAIEGQFICQQSLLIYKYKLYEDFVYTLPVAEIYSDIPPHLHSKRLFLALF
jgi:hypothetical protein